MSESKFPKGWDQSRVDQLLKIHEEKTDDELADEDDATLEPCENETLIRVPNRLLLQIRQLIADQSIS